MAHGYAKARGKPIMVLCHDVVGLLHATNAIYQAYIDRVPIIIVGGTGPMDVTKRRPWIDWIHTVLINSNLIRGYIKWDDQPFNIMSVPDSLIRAYRVATMEPKGPVFVCLDAAMQEEHLEKPIKVPEVDRYLTQSRIQGDPDQLTEAAELLLKAELPVIVPEFMGKNPKSVAYLVKLTELMATPVYDLEGRFNFPNTHPMDMTGSDVIERADLILMLDVRQPQKVLKKADSVTRTARYIVRDDAKIVQIGLEELTIRGLTQELGRIEPSDLSIIADTSIALPFIIAACKKNMSAKRRAELEKRFEDIRAQHERLRRKWLQKSKGDWRSRPLSASRLAAEVWDAVQGHNWVVTGANLMGWVRRLWEITDTRQFIGWTLGTSTNIGTSLGVALACKKSNSLVVDIQPDGDLMYDCGALWIGAHHNIPMLVIMYNNRAYGNSLMHQSLIARQRGRNIDNAGIGTEIDNPPPNFAQMARSMGCYGFGPIKDPEGLKHVLEEAIRLVEARKVPVLVDTICKRNEK